MLEVQLRGDVLNQGLKIISTWVMSVFVKIFRSWGVLYQYYFYF